MSKKGKHRLKTVAPNKLWSFKLEGYEEVPLGVVGIWRKYQCTDVLPGGRLLVRVLDVPRSPTATPARDKKPSQFKPENQLWPLPLGASTLEKLGESPEALTRVRILATRKNDPKAWRELACGYRVRRLRKPIEQALRTVGPEKILALIKRWPGPWPPEVREFVQREVDDAEAGRRAFVPPIPGSSMMTRYWED